jgi:branched-chain amino acid transport system substrate-binding protein
MSFFNRIERAVSVLSVVLIILLGTSCVTMRGTRLPDPSRSMLSSFNGAESDFRSGRYQDALSGYLYCIDEFPKNTLTDNALIKAGDIYLASGDLSTAENLYLRVVREFVFSDTYDEARYKLGQIYYKLGRYHDAVEILKSLARDSRYGANSVKTSVTLANSYFMIGDYLSAIYWFSDTADLAPDPSTKSEAYKNIETIVEGYLSEEELSDLSDDFRGRAAGGYASYVLAQRYTIRGDIDEAREELLKIVRTQPDHEYYYEAQGLLNEIRGSFTVGAEITVGVILPLSGRNSAFGNRVRTGMDFASGALGFTDGPKIRLIIKDSGASPTTASYAVRDLAKNDDVIAIVGPMVKDTALAAAYDAQKLHVPIITLTRESGITDIGDFVFRNFLTNADEIRGLVRYIIQGRGLCNFAVLYPEDAYGNEMKDLFSREVSYYGCSVVGEKSYTDETQDFRSTIEELLADTGETTRGKANFDALFIPDYYNVVGLIIPYIFFFDLKGVTLIGTDGWNDPGLVEITGDFLVGSYFADAFTPNSNRSEVKQFVEDFISIFGREPGVLEAYGYDTIKMIQYLVKTQGIDDREEMKEALLSIREYRGVTGYTSIERNGDSTKDPMILTVMESEEEPLLTIAEEPEEGVAIAEEIPETIKKKLIIVEVPDSLRY